MEGEEVYNDYTDNGSVSSQGSMFFNICENEDEAKRYTMDDCRLCLDAMLRGATPSAKSSASSFKYLSRTSDDQTIACEMDEPVMGLRFINLDHSSEKTMLNRRLTLSNLNISLIDEAIQDKNSDKGRNEKSSPKCLTNTGRKSKVSMDAERRKSELIIHRGRRFRKSSQQHANETPQMAAEKKLSMDILGEPMNLLSRVPGIQHEYPPHPPTFNFISPSPTLSASYSIHSDESSHLRGLLLRKPIETRSVNSSSSGTLSPASQVDTRSMSPLSSASSEGSTTLGRTPTLKRKNLLPPLVLSSRQTSASSKSSQESLLSASPLSSPVLGRKDVIESALPAEGRFFPSPAMENNGSPPVSIKSRSRRSAVISLKQNSNSPAPSSRKRTGDRRRRKRESRVAHKSQTNDESEDSSGSPDSFDSVDQHSTTSSYASSLEVSPRTPDLFEESKCLFKAPDELSHSRSKSFLPSLESMSISNNTGEGVDLRNRQRCQRSYTSDALEGDCKSPFSDEFH
ncbi:hypothetical protein CAPTEDRAFT_186955 [Capitella teleta]|uniref:Uncharacterized protein n=1 Tax=Capitella teleta TaxID=283909 RepID=R7TM00_CAPTE|nr:hypothetical protein CAPTEDRAFT_186955 [Capitella teleta]|eukprot:ELT92586.1 hypothetical protein CAPTEDRAFT_186955 [Capitella teleta]